MAWINYTYNSDMDNLRSGVMHALQVLEAVKNATLTECVDFDVSSKIKSN